MKGYKGFNKKFQCRQMQYEVGKSYTEDNASLCACGLHFCESPFDVFSYYHPRDLSRYATVSTAFVSQERDRDSKRAAKELTINKELSLPGFLKEGVNTIDAWGLFNRKYIKTESDDHSSVSSRETNSHITAERDHSVAAAVNSSSTVVANDCCSIAATTELFGIADVKQRDSVAVCTNYDSIAVAEGDGSVSVNVYDGLAITSGLDSIAVTTNTESIASALGKYSLAIATARTSCAIASGKESIAMAFGENGMAMGELGCWLILSDWKGDENCGCHREDLRCVKIDGKKIKANTFYKLENGEIMEVK